MAGEDIKRRSRRKNKHPVTSRKSSHKLDENHDPASASAATSERPPNLDALRKARLEYLETPPDERRKRMKYVYDQPIASKSRSTKGDKRDRQSTVSLARRRSEEPRKRRKRKDPDDSDAQSENGYVYGQPEEKRERARAHGSGSKSRSRDHLAPKATTNKSISSKATVKRELPRRNTEPPRRRNSCPTDER